MLQLLKPACPGAWALQQAKSQQREAWTLLRVAPCSPQQQRRPSAAKISE